MRENHRQQAVRRAQAELQKDPVYLDTETTGMRNSDTVIELAVIDSDGSPLIDTLVKPRGRIPPGAVNIHGITDEMTAGAPAWPDVWPRVENSLTDRSVAVYNVGFDLRMIKQTHTQHWMQWQPPAGARFFDVMEIYAQYHGEWDPRRKRYRYLSLERAGKACGIPLPNSHRAKDDCLLTRALLHYLAERG